MKLLLDLGNSCLKWAVAVDGRLTEQGVLETRDGMPPGVIGPLHELRMPPDEIRMANVAGAEHGRRLAESLKARFRVPVVEARSPAAGAGVRNGYRDPAQLGIDRWLALCAAYSARPGVPACVVDAGTATTLDVVAADGTHRGGLILPGLGMMADSLHRDTGNLARLSRWSVPGAEAPAAGTQARSLGIDTAEAIGLGALRATTSLVNACMASMDGEAPGKARLVLTGGNAPRLLTLLDVPAEHRPALVLEGLALDPPCFAGLG